VPDLEETLGYTFADESLLTLALTHRSLEAEDERELSNERLEFLGDAVLGLVIADELLASWDMDEGGMAKVRAAVVSEAALAGVARQLGLGDHLRLGKGEQISGGKDKSSILADALEAVIGAVFLDGGFSPARSFIVGNWRDLLTERAVAPGERDYKTRLQEVLARRGDVPEYSVGGVGPDHAREFTASVLVDGSTLGGGTGSSKKRAEQEAAREALAALGEGDA
jgi:ribonuclease-3